MLELFRDGGWSMYVIVAFGLVSLASAGYHAALPDERHEGFLKWMSQALLWAILVGLASDIGTTLHFTCKIEDANERSRTITEGLAESMSPGILGFAMLAVVAFLTAIGRRRLDARRP